MQQGLYEQLITKLISSKLETINKDQFFIKETIIEKSEAAKVLSHYVSEVANSARSGIGKRAILYLTIGYK